MGDLRIGAGVYLTLVGNKKKIPMTECYVESAKTRLRDIYCVSVSVMYQCGCKDADASNLVPIQPPSTMSRQCPSQTTHNPILPNTLLHMSLAASFLSRTAPPFPSTDLFSIARREMYGITYGGTLLKVQKDLKQDAYVPPQVHRRERT